ncbi:MAG: hypothetical protein DWQ42_11050 [Planctomycetota bacterium]|nr:MAG: hypothetical protein DWQ42_11050 [Planctomycetota bacterium]REK40851.1 MAG: hypothetical protein DWQ46_15270 [Planctomycetota bacterium]
MPQATSCERHVPIMNAHTLGRWSVAVVVGCGFAMLFAATGCNEPTATSESNTPGTPGPAKTDAFHFHYNVTINNLEPGAQARVWLPVAQTNHDQDVQLVSVEVPGEHDVYDEGKFDNQVIYFEAAANDNGEIPIKVAYQVVRRELTAESGEEVVDEELANFLAPSRFVPNDEKLLYQVVGDKRPEGEGEELADELYNAVYRWMEYGKPKDKAWGRGDSVYACDARIGNCTDFHSLFISMCRVLKLPAKFEIGFMLPEDGAEGEVGGYHCWAKFAHEGRWVAVDISEADKDATMKDYYFGSLTPNRVTFTTGRDLQLSPPPAAGEVNFLVYPYVEVEGKEHKDFAKDFRFVRLD